MAGFCSFSAILGGKCESSRGHTDCIALNDYDGDISLHLANHHLSRENSCERDLILARAGLLELTEEKIKNMMVCPAHRFTLEKYWQAPKTCQYPRHHGKKSAETGTHVVNFKLAREIKNLFGEAAPVGSQPEFQKSCSHQHLSTCDDCQGLKKVLQELRLEIEGPSWTPVNSEQREDLLYDFDRAKSDIFLWKAHIVRSINQEEAKQDLLKTADATSAIVIMDWVMKFLQLKYREKQSEWFGKRGLSWHISTVITKNVSTGNHMLTSLIPASRIVKEAQIHNATSTDGEETSGLFSCPEPGCQMVFKKVSELENHLDVGEHRQMRGGSETVYDKLRRDWAEKFLNVDNNEGSSSAPVAHCDERGDEFEYQAPSFCSDLQLGWALHKARNQGVRFPDDVKQYLTRKFDLGERTGNKADPGKVAADMRTARRPDGLRIFDRLAATRRKQGNQELQMEDVYAEEEEEERREVLESVAAELSPRHPICYDSYCLCDLARDESLDSFSVVMLKEILRYFEIPFGSRDRKKI
ncbi:hypothetical protein ACROYT_G000821 [Oculina patagonica]